MNAPARLTYTYTYLQYLRGIAALMVVYFHSVSQLENMAGAPTVLPLFGESGVDLFFVLSGFLMWITTDRSRVTPKSFMINRLIRIVPLYWGLTLAASAVALWFPQLLKHTQFDGIHVLSSLFFIPSANPSYLSGAGEALKFTPLLVPGWTLNYEMFFYVIFAVLMYFQNRLRVSLILGVFLLVCLAGAGGEGVNSVLEFYANPIIFEFMFGIFIALLVRRGQVVPLKVAVPIFMVSAVALIGINIANMNFCRAIEFGVPAALIVYSLCCVELQAGGLQWRLLKSLGDASFSLYLTHVFTLVVCRVIFIRFIQYDSVWLEVAFILLSLVLSSTVALGVYQLFEKPTAVYLKRLRY